MNEYMEAHEIWKDLFQACFGSDADVYWKIFRNITFQSLQ